MIKVYPSIIHPEGDGGYWLEFPDLEGCQTQGDTMEEVMAMAQEALGLYLASLMERSLELPAPSDIKSIEADGCQTTYVVVDIDNYRRDTRAVKKNGFHSCVACSGSYRKQRKLVQSASRCIKRAVKCYIKYGRAYLRPLFYNLYQEVYHGILCIFEEIKGRPGGGSQR